MTEFISIRGARENNLEDVTLEIPKGKPTAAAFPVKSRRPVLRRAVTSVESRLETDAATSRLAS